MPRLRIGINGFGRIGRCALRVARRRDDIEVVAINDLADKRELAHLLRYDSVHRRWPEEVRLGERGFSIGGSDVSVYAQKDPAAIPWREAGVSVVIESTGVFTKRARAAAHLEAGVSRVIISAPSKDADATFVMGVNDDTYDPDQHRVVSMASCTTNCLAPVAKVLHESFGIEHAMITTVHAYTSTQAILDAPTGDLQRSRAAGVSIIPSTTGAAVATALVLPALKGRMDGLALRVPVPDGSVTDVVARLDLPASVQSVNDALREAAGRPPLHGILTVSEDPLVSSDVLGDPHSSIVDAPSTMMIGDRVVKVLAWYDNEWGYATRLIDLAARIAD
jgi:glyceraldehyde 3-phosphate dehydrogenase